MRKVEQCRSHCREILRFLPFGFAQGRNDSPQVAGHPILEIEMPNIRALTDLNVKSIYIPLNRVALVDDDTAAELVASGLASDDEGHVGQALQMNPEVIELAAPGAAKPKSVRKPADPNIGEDTSATEKSKKATKSSPSVEESTGLFGE
jgi:hypothetical protein